MNRRFNSLRSFDPRTKLHILLMYIVMSAAAWNALAMAVTVLAAALVIYMCRENLQPVISMSLVLIIIDVLLGVVCVIALPIKYGFYLAVKLLLLTFVYLLIMKSMKPGEMLDGLAIGFGLRAKTAKRLYILLDFIPKVYREKRRGRKAQRARGISPDGVKGAGSRKWVHFLNRLRQEALLAIPNIKYAFTRSKRQAEAMTRRQYLSTLRRNTIYELKLSIVDKLASIAYMILMLAAIILTILL